MPNDHRRFLALIPARGGSKRVPGKNRRLLAGKPLIQWTIEAAQEAEQIDTVCVSSDDQAIIDLGRQLGVEAPFVRPAELATDTARSTDVALHALDWYEQRGEYFDYVVLLQPTSPLRSAEHIRQAIEVLDRRRGDAVISVCPVAHSPLWSNTLPEDDSLSGFLPDEVIGRRSQDLPSYYRLNGAIYIVRPERLREERTFFLADNIFAYRMPEVVSVDIDTELDFLMAETLIRHQRETGALHGDRDD